MTTFHKNIKKRLQIVEDTIRQYGLEVNGVLYLSYFEMCHDINNTWNAKYFINPKVLKDNPSIGKQNPRYHSLVLEPYAITNLARLIKATIKRHKKIAIMKSQSNSMEFYAMRITKSLPPSQEGEAE